MKNKLIIFDCDGTVIDSMPTLTQLATDVIVKSQEISELAAKHLYEVTVGIPFRDQLEIMFPGNVKNSHTAICYEVDHQRTAPTFPIALNIKELFAELREKGFKLALVTSTDWTILRDHLPQVNKLGFDFMSGYCPDNKKSKQIAHAMKILGIDRKNTFYVGDTAYDEICALDNGIKFIATTVNTLQYDVLYAVNRIR